MMTYAKLPLAGLLLATMLLPAAAQEAAGQQPLAEADGVLTLDRLGHHLSMPMPDWLEAPSGPIESQVQISYAGDERQASVELRPRGETRGAVDDALWGADHADE